jgi:hypothetical protein
MKQVMQRQFARKVRLQGLPAALELWSLERSWNKEALEEAAARALARRVPNITGVRRMLTELKGSGEEAVARRAIPLRSKRASARSRRRLLS